MKHNNIIAGIVICMVVFMIVICVMLATPAHAYEGDRITTARQDALHSAADSLRMAGLAEDDPAIMALSAEWWAEQEKMDILAKVVAHEADPAYCQPEHSLAVAVVVLNREASPYFPNSVKEVVAAPGQYLPAYTYGFENTPRRCYEIAKAALDGEHDIPDDCYWQAEFPQGVRTWKVFRVNTGYYASVTYICRGIPGVS
jgi:hypothetical protein